MKVTYRVDVLPMKKSSNMLKLKFLQTSQITICFYGVYDDKDLMNITYGSVDEIVSIICLTLRCLKYQCKKM